MSNTLLKWLTDNLPKTNPEYLKESQTNIGGMVISKTTCEKLLGIHIDNKLSFEPNIGSLRQKTSKKLNAIARIAYSLKFEQRKRLLNAFIRSQFSQFSYAIFLNISQSKIK